MRRVSEIAIDECIAELRAACRRPIDQVALETLVSWLRPNFERILDHPDGGKRWADVGQQMRNNGRYLGSLANFFGDHADKAIVGINELTPAFEMVRAACRVGAGDSPAQPAHASSPAEGFLRAIAIARSVTNTDHRTSAHASALK